MYIQRSRSQVLCGDDVVLLYVKYEVHVVRTATLYFDHHFRRADIWQTLQFYRNEHLFDEGTMNPMPPRKITHQSAKEYTQH